MERKKRAAMVSQTQLEQLAMYRQKQLERSMQEKLEGEIILSKAKSDIAEDKAKAEDYKRKCRQDNLEMTLVMLPFLEKCHSFNTHTNSL